MKKRCSGRTVRQECYRNAAAVIENLSVYKVGDFYANDMTVNNNGGKWVHTWFTWVGKTRNGKDVVFPVNISIRVIDNKIVITGLIYNALPGYLASQPSDTTEVSP